MKQTNPVILIGESELNDWMNTPFNPPEKEKHDEFDSEYWTTHEKIIAGIELLGEKGFTEGDFCPNDDFEESRVVSIELTTEKLFCKELIPLCQHLLSREKIEYEVMISHDLLNEEDFWIFVTKNETKAHFENLDHLEQFGLERTSQITQCR